MGERGEGKFERISWDEALDTVAGEMSRIKETYGAKAILEVRLSGGSGAIHTGMVSLGPFLKSFGGSTEFWGDASVEGGLFASRATYGTLTNGNTKDDLVNIFSTNTRYHLLEAKDAGARIIVIDPRYTDTAATFADQWIPVKPGTDTAVMAAMAHAMIAENLFS